MYQIEKVINNNIVCALDESGCELILRGLGIGFQKRAKDWVPKEQVEKVYKIAHEGTRNKLQSLLENIPMTCITTCTNIIEYAKMALGKELNEKIYLTLTDHVSFAMERASKQMLYANPLLVDIKCFYPKEYQVGLYALAVIEKEMGVRLPVDEAGFIAMHLVNAQLGTDMSDMVQITELIQSALEIIQTYYGVSLDSSSLDYDRLVTHLKFFGQRIFQNQLIQGEDVLFQQMVQKQYPKDYACAGLIRSFIKKKYKKQIGEEEMVFLTVHLRRIVLQKQ